MIRKLILSASSVVLMYGAPAAAYDIRTNVKIGPKEVFYLDDVHESITKLAEQCLRPGQTERPTGCWTSASAIAALSRSEAGEAYSPTQKASRWPDDPTRQSSLHTYPKLGLALKYGCKDLAKDGENIENLGLLCSSHYGRLQFMHAMAGPLDPTAEDTHRRILEWARFAYRVASKRQSLDENYCKAIDKQPAALKAALQMSDRSFCGKRTRMLFWSYAPWTVRTFFVLRCSGPFQSRWCSEDVSAEADENARLAATGALLHLVQDSFSQAHAHRSAGAPVPEQGPFTSKVVCRFPTDYFDYGVQTANQSEKIHGASDKPPATIDPSCKNKAQTDDVVTASAAILWHLRENKSDDAFIEYLVDRVFGPRPGSTVNLRGGSGSTTLRGPSAAPWLRSGSPATRRGG
jgi:hypothetical protein